MSILRSLRYYRIKNERESFVNKMYKIKCVSLFKSKESPKIMSNSGFVNTFLNFQSKIDFLKYIFNKIETPNTY